MFNQMMCVVVIGLGGGCVSTTHPGTCSTENNYFVVGVESNGMCSPAKLNECAPDANTAHDRTKASYTPTATVYVCHNLQVSENLLCLPDRGILKPLPSGCTTFQPTS
jgi:hypothetical protein